MTEPTKLEQVVEAVSEMTELLRQMHAAIKDGNQLLRNIEDSKKELENIVKQKYDEVSEEHIGELLDAKLSEMGVEIRIQQQKLYDRIDKSFEEYVNILKYGNKQGRGIDALEELAMSKFRRRK